MRAHQFGWALCTMLVLAIVQQLCGASGGQQPLHGLEQSYMGRMIQRVGNSSAARLAANTNVAARQSMSKLLLAKNWRVPNFQQFKSNFGLHYVTGLEESVRQHIFAARVLEAAKSVWRYVSNKSETYNSINSRSAMTAEEREQVRARRPQQLVNEQLLASGQIALMDNPDRHRVGSSRGGRGGSGDSCDSGTGGGGLFGVRPQPPPAPKAGSSSWYSWLGGGSGLVSVVQKNDLRAFKCFLPPSDQGTCESCASFVAMAQLEYLHCREKDELVKFSEQYPIDCGTPFGMMGCAGTDVASLNQFIATAGVERADAYPYTGSKSRCPYSYARQMGRVSAWDQAGYLKLRHRGLSASPRTSWSKYLDRGIPLHVGVLTSEAFEDYGGGVASSCARDSGAHGMLLIGEGRDNGHDYWLLRNSYGVAWGEEGYFRLNKRATQCFTDDGRGYFQQAFTQSMGDSLLPNRQHTPRVPLAKLPIK